MHGASRSSRDGSPRCPSSRCSLPVHNKQQLSSRLHSLAFLRSRSASAHLGAAWESPISFQPLSQHHHQGGGPNPARLLEKHAVVLPGGEAGMQELLGPLGASQCSHAAAGVSQPGSAGLAGAWGAWQCLAAGCGPAAAIMHLGVGTQLPEGSCWHGDRAATELGWPHRKPYPGGEGVMMGWAGILGKDEVGGHGCATEEPILSAGFAIGSAVRASGAAEAFRGLLCWVLGKRETAFCATGTYGSKAERPWCDSRKVQLVMGGCCEGAVGSSDPPAAQSCIWREAGAEGRAGTAGAQQGGRKRRGLSPARQLWGLEGVNRC